MLINLVGTTPHVTVIRLIIYATVIRLIMQQYQEGSYLKFNVSVVSGPAAFFHTAKLRIARDSG